MQYEPGLTRDQLIELATKTYFGNVDAKNLEGALACFHDEALFCVQTAFTRHAGKAEIKRMFEDFFGAYAKIVHKDFTCTVDEKNGRITAGLTARSHSCSIRISGAFAMASFRKCMSISAGKTSSSNKSGQGVKK